ncbi:MAG: SDR family oxidoreductase [Deltaproteobacteria bacterium]|nr:SDR family oxidoreductase [Deltaproteobacteria bacterium]
MMKLEGRVALVTGAGSRKGIGQSIAMLLAQEGAAVAVNDVNREWAQQAVEEIRKSGGEALALPADVSREDQVKNMINAVVEKWRGLDILVNNAGITQAISVLEMSEEDWNRILDVNLKGTFLCTREALPYMIRKGWGRIVCISSVSGKKGGGRIGGVHYAASKAGILGFTKALVREISPKGITANAICPGTIDTGKDPGRRMWNGRPALEGLEEARNTIPIGRVGTPEDVARAVLFLVSEDADFINGEVMDVNGGAYID